MMYNSSLIQNETYNDEVQGFQQYLENNLENNETYKDFNFIKIDIQDPQNKDILSQPIDNELVFGIYIANEQFQKIIVSPTPEQIDDVLSYALIPIDNVQPYHVTGELDLLEAYETFRHRDAVLYLLQRNCSICHQVYIEALKVASSQNLSFYSVNCSESPIASWVCTRRNPRSNPWVQLLIGGKFYNYDFGDNHELPTYKNILSGYLKAKKGEIQPEQESQKETFTVEWMNENPTKIVDGKPVEWPMRPNKKATYEQIDNLQQRLDAIQKKYEVRVGGAQQGNQQGSNNNQKQQKKGFSNFIKNLFK